MARGNDQHELARRGLHGEVAASAPRADRPRSDVHNVKFVHQQQPPPAHTPDQQHRLSGSLNRRMPRVSSEKSVQTKEGGRVEEIKRTRTNRVLSESVIMHSSRQDAAASGWRTIRKSQSSLSAEDVEEVSSAFMSPAASFRKFGAGVMK